MNIFVPLLSLIGPIYFAARGWPLEFVVAWAALWTGLRLIATSKSVFEKLRENDGDEPMMTWYPYVAFAGVFLATFAMFGATHLVVYWTICRSIRVSN
ncbi:hypothetical protein LB565_25595 [Mesorhizobium sp. CA14]|uniref:hypothetical protein n=1 Tax=Mesorhizobium sp. CA14 TaxID=2876642 RepID=UPI001CCB5745|nr:hypothetical protein [Mesorhizobium sp. CA14]MBZ9851367.1 hypothetical protein [Mesorhizobium sp. CA14]